jgi:hypothetical protein
MQAMYCFGSIFSLRYIKFASFVKPSRHPPWNRDHAMTSTFASPPVRGDSSRRGGACRT